MESKGNFMSRFADTYSSALKHLTSQQFFEVWNNYDQDGKLDRTNKHTNVETCELFQ